MGWTLFGLKFELLSGVHSGSYPVGNILKTRGYVTGRTFWGAATASLVAHGLAPRTQQGYEEAGNKTRSWLRFGYLFPYVLGESMLRVPMGCLERTDEWEYRFLDTYSSTALDYGQGSAEQGSLHEIEYIRTCTRPMLTLGLQTVMLMGHVAVREDQDVAVSSGDAKVFGVSLKGALSEIQLGGKRNYGFGRVRLAGALTRCDEIFGCPFLMRDGGVRLPATIPAPAHVEMGKQNLPEAARPEPLIGREWREGNGFGSGQYITDATLCWGPGATFKDERRYLPDALGVWHEGVTV